MPLYYGEKCDAKRARSAARGGIAAEGSRWIVGLGVMTIVSGVIGTTGYKFPDFDLEYQIERHVEMMLRQWPQIDRKTEQRHTRRLLLKGQAWLWPEPEPAQLSLFD